MKKKDNSDKFAKQESASFLNVMKNDIRRIKITKYKTSHLDEASFLAVKGHSYTTANFGDLVSEWKFYKSEELAKHVRQFWGGNANVNLHKWLALRTILKTEQKRLVPIAIDNPLKLINGEQYWYLNDKKQPMATYFGKSSVHAKRIQSGNMFRTREEALRNITTN